MQGGEDARPGGCGGSRTRVRPARSISGSLYFLAGRIIVSAVKSHEIVFGMNPLRDHAPASIAPIDSFRNPGTKVFLCLRNEFRFTTALSLYNAITTPFTTPFTTLFHFVLLLLYYSF
jgi:hypothetical protein